MWWTLPQKSPNAGNLVKIFTNQPRSATAIHASRAVVTYPRTRPAPPLLASLVERLLRRGGTSHFPNTVTALTPDRPSTFAAFRSHTGERTPVPLTLSSPTPRQRTQHRRNPTHQQVRLLRPNQHPIKRPVRQDAEFRLLRRTTPHHEPRTRLHPQRVRRIPEIRATHVQRVIRTFYPQPRLRHRLQQIAVQQRQTSGHIVPSLLRTSQT